MNEWEWQLLEDKAAVESVEISGVMVRAGDRVRLRPGKGGDVLDIALAGQTAAIEAIEQDYEGKFHVCVVLDDDPGRDMVYSVNRGIDSSSMWRKWSRCLRKNKRWRRPLTGRASSSRGLATSSWATTRLVWK